MMRSRSIDLKLFLTLLGIGLGVGACQRSSGFKRDQGYYKSEPTSYYDKASGKGSKSVTQRVEMMGQPKKRVMVIDFWNDTPVRQADLGLFAADELRRGLHHSQRLIIPTDVRSALTTEDVIQGDKVKVAQLIREGRRLSVSVLVIGRVTKIIFRQSGDNVGLFRQKQSIAAVDVEIKLFDVAAGREILATGKSGEAMATSTITIESENVESPEYRAEMSKLAVRNTVRQLVPDVLKAVEKMTWEGHVAKIQNGKVYINAGKTSGLVAGDILKVMTQGDDVYDPTSGAYLGRSQGQLKGTLEVVDFIGPDAASTEIHTGGNFQEGDVVQLY